MKSDSGVRTAIRRRAIFLGLAGAGFVFISVAEASNAAAEDPPITLSLRWHGEPCNAQGDVDVVVHNSSDRKLQAPAVGGFGIDALFIAIVRSGNSVVTTFGPHYGSFLDHAALKRGDGAVTINPRAERLYTLRIADGYDPAGDEVTPAYRLAREKGREIQINYFFRELDQTGWTREGFFSIGPDAELLIKSNTLTCPMEKVR